MVGGFRSNVGRSIGVAAQGVANLGAAFDREDKFNAERKFTEFAYEQEQSYSETLKNAQPGAAGLRDSVVGGYQDSAKKFLKSIPDHLKGEYDGKLLDYETRLSRNADGFETKERERFSIEGVTDAHNKLALLVEADPTKYKEAAESSRVLLETVPTDNITRETLRKKFSGVVAKAGVEGILKAGGTEADVRDFIKGQGPAKSVPQSGIQGQIANNVSNAPYALAVAERESSFKHDAKASKTIRGLFQVDGPTREQYGIPESGDTEAQARGFDKMTGDRVAALGKAIGRAPTAKDAYLAHRYGVGGATALLNADPEMSTKDWVFETFGNKARAVWDQNPDVRKAGTVGNLINRESADIERRMAKYGGDANAEYGAGASAGVDSDIEAFAQTRIVAHRDAFERRERARVLDEERNARIQERQKKDASDAEEVALMGAIADPAKQSQVTAQSIAQNPKLTREAIQRMTSLVSRADSTDNTYGSAFYEMFQRVHLPDGDPNKINNLDQLVPLVGSGLKVSGYNELARQLQSGKSPEEEAEKQMLNQFLKTAHQELSGTNPMLGIRDPKGEEINLRFMSQALPTYYKLRGQGKTPAQLLDPDSPEYLGKGIKTLKRSTNEMVRDMLSGMGGEADTSTPQGLIAAVQSGKVPREEGERIAVERGWVRASTPAIAPPMSR
jgi:hypothetical protein